METGHVLGTFQVERQQRNRVDPCKYATSWGDVVKNFGARDPGSNRRRLAWEFPIELDVFFFCSKHLVDIFCS